MAQQNEGKNDSIYFSIPDAQEMDRRLKDYELLRQLDIVKDQRIANLEKEVALLKMESDLKDRIIAIKDMEIQSKDRSFNDLKEVADRSLKLAEISKPKPDFGNWQLTGLAIFVGYIIKEILTK